MRTDREDIVELSDYAWGRFRDRMAGLTDDEWRWQPTKDDDLSLRWRLAHIAHFLAEDRNGPWLGLPVAAADLPPATDAVTALANVDGAYALWRAQLADAELAQPIGAVGGPYGAGTRRSFALHIVDELIHHTAEAALFRDLYSGRL
ncbi:MAG TPA: DinB family protein [Pseudonocardiaceae bacterium]|jgi:hypothetical protein|nr:DinB family protein [Pseudonocardiaceae bacterium]